MADLSVARASGIEGFERHVVIKHLRPDQSDDGAFVQMFLTEARLAGALHHHNIVQVHDIGQENGTHFFAMEYVHGEDLRHMLSRLSRRDEQPPFEHVVTIITSAAAALHHAHEQKGADRQPLGIVHRDVTPANIIIAYDGNVKVVDFGIAKATIQTIKTQTGTLKGKVPYMSPEQCTGKAVDRRSDVFALGIVLYELTTTRRLFKGNNEFYVMSAVISGEIPPPSLHRKDLPKALENIILKALSRKPSDRYQTADEMRSALESFAESAGLRTSASSLAAFMKKLFGERPEPWTKEAKDSTNETDVDFDSDKTETGVVEIPPEVIEKRVIPKAVATTRGSLIEQARLNAISSDLEVITSAPKPRTKTPLPSVVNKPEPRPEPKAKGTPPNAMTKPADRAPPSERKSGERAGSNADTVVKTNGVHVKTPGHVDQPTVPLKVPSRPVKIPAPTPVIDREETDLDDATELSGPPDLIEDLAPRKSLEKTDIANPPPPPLPPGVVESSLPERDPTAIVKPLPVPTSRARSQVLVVPGDEDTASTSKLDRRWLLAGGIGIAALAVAIVVVMTGSKDLSKPPELLDLKAQAAANTAADEPAPVEPAEPKPVEPAEVKPAEPAEVKPAEPAEVKPAEPAEVKPAEPAEVKPAEPAEVKPAEVKPAEVKPAEVKRANVAAKPPPKMIRKPVKTATKPKPKPTKPTKDPKWDPNALFLKKKP
jgi:serine/threonine protein kinase